MSFPHSRIVCLSVCLSACPLAYLKNYTKFSVHVTCASSADDRVMRCVLPVLWTTSHFQIMEGIDRIKDDAVSSSSPGDGINRTSGNVSWLRSRGGGTGGEVCRLWLHLVADCIPALSALSAFFSVLLIRCLVFISATVASFGMPSMAAGHLHGYNKCLCERRNSP